VDRGWFLARAASIPVSRAIGSLVLSRGAREPVAFPVLVDGDAPGRSGGVAVGEDGNGGLCDRRRYQFVRQHGAVASSSWR